MAKGTLDCIICNKKIRHLKSHMEYHRINEKDWPKYIIRLSPVEKVHTCDECAYKTKFKSNLNKHKNQTHKDNYFSCHICLKRFKSITGQKEHINSIHKDQRFNCSECSTTFRQMKSFRAHMNRYHQGLFTSDIITEAYKCNVCDKYFTYMKKDHNCTDIEHNWSKVQGYRQFLVNPEQMNKRKLTLSDKVDELLELLDVPQDVPQEVQDEISDFYPLPENLNLLIKIELDDQCEPIENNSTRSRAGCLVVFPKSN